jgi:RimJ/RimL family protein N-acetyltransferase
LRNAGVKSPASNNSGIGSDGKRMVTLETDRLILRMLRASDFDAYAEMHSDPEVMR